MHRLIKAVWMVPLLTGCIVMPEEGEDPTTGELVLALTGGTHIANLFVGFQVVGGGLSMRDGTCLASGRAA